MRLLTYAPSAGYQQNPISVYFCEDSSAKSTAASPAGSPRARARAAAAACAPRTALAEVTNTPWGERVRFAFTVGQPDCVPKPMHVSPLFEMQLFWRISCSVPGEDVALSFTTYRSAAAAEAGGGDGLFLAALRLRRVPPPRWLPPQAWAWMMPHRVAVWIYLQAARLMCKGVPFLPHPKYEGGDAYRAVAAAAEAVNGRGRPARSCPAFLYREASEAPWTWS